MLWSFVTCVITFAKTWIFWLREWIECIPRPCVPAHISAEARYSFCCFCCCFWEANLTHLNQCESDRSRTLDCKRLIRYRNVIPSSESYGWSCEPLAVWSTEFGPGAGWNSGKLYCCLSHELLERSSELFEAFDFKEIAPLSLQKPLRLELLRKPTSEVQARV